MEKYKIIAVDLQQKFVDENKEYYGNSSCVQFIEDKLIPFFEDNNLRISEINSDYRQPRCKNISNSNCDYTRPIPCSSESCVPGTQEFQSVIPDKIRKGNIWYKCMHNPLWTRENIGKPNETLGDPFQDVKGFDHWLNESIGFPPQKIILFGLTLDCCILSMAQELYWRIYEVSILEEATDITPKGEKQNKKELLRNYPFTNWVSPISWEQFKDTVL